MHDSNVCLCTENLLKFCFMFYSCKFNFVGGPFAFSSLTMLPERHLQRKNSAIAVAKGFHK